MSDFMAGVWVVLAFILMCFGIAYIKGPFFEKRECESTLPRHIECTYQPPVENDHE